MVFHGSKWGWRRIATRLLLAPVLTAGLAAPVFAQTPERPAATQSASPADLLKMGREALKAGKFDQAQDLARQADAANKSGRWGFFGDTPESLEKDIRSARAKADQLESERLMKTAKELMTKPAVTPAEQLANLEQAYALCDRAVALAGPADFLDSIFGGDRPEKLKKEIDAARMVARRKVPASELAKSPTPPTRTPSTVTPVVGTAASEPKVTTASFTTPTDSASPAKVEAGRLLAEGRMLSKKNMLAEARAKAVEAQRLTVQYGPNEDTPDALLRDIINDGKMQIESLCKKADEHIAQKSWDRAEAALGLAAQMSATLGFPSRVVEDKLASVKAAKTGNTTVTVAASTPVVPTVPGVPTVPAVPAASSPTAPITLPDAVTASSVPAAPTVPSVLTTPSTKPALASGSPSAPLALPVPGAVPSTPAVANAAVTGKELIAQAETELRKGDLEMARKLATQAHTTDATAKDDAQAMLRLIDAEEFARKKKDATLSLRSAVEAMTAKQFDQAVGVLKLIDPALLTPEQKKQHESLLATATTEAARQLAAPVATTQSTTAQPPATGLSDQVQALAEVEFQKLRAEGLEAETKAKEAYGRGDTDVALALLNDFTAKVKASSLSAGRQKLLLDSVDRRANMMMMMKRQTDFVTREARDKRDARDRVVGKQLIEQQQKEEIARKVREVNELAKAHKYREAEALALQLKTLDPDDPALTAVYEMAKRQRAVDDYAKIKDSKEAMVLQGLNASEKPGVFVDVDNPLHVDVQRALIAMKRGDGTEIYQKNRTAAERDIELRLEKPLSIDFKQTPLKEAIDKLRQQTALNITLDDAAIADETISVEQVLITDSLKDLSLKSVLSIVLSKARLKYVVEDDVIKITTEKRAKGRMVMKVFPVMDLVTPIPDYQLHDHQNFDKQMAKASNSTPGWSAAGPNGMSALNPNSGFNNGTMVSGQPWSGPAGGPQMGGGILQNDPNAKGVAVYDGPVQAARVRYSQQLVKMISSMVKPYAWQEMGGPGKVEYWDIGGALVVNQTADIIREVEDLLQALRRLQETSVAVEVRVISLSEAFFERVGVDFSMNVKTKQGGRDGSAFESALTTGQFRPEPFINDINVNNVTVGWNPAAGGFTPDLDVPIRSTSFPLSAPPFGGYQSLSPTLNGGLSVGLAFLNDVQVFMFMEAAQGDRRVNVMQAPKITLYNGQTATVFVSDVAFFTLGVQVFNVGGQMVYVPSSTPIPIGSSPPPPGSQVGNPTPGVSVTVQAIVSADRRFVRMNLTPTLTSLTSATVPLFPVTAFITPVFEGGSQGVPIPFTQFFQQPSISEIQVQTTVAVPDGGTVVLGGLKTMSEGRNEFGPPVLSQVPYINRLFRNQGIGRETRHIMIMVTPRIIIQSEEELNQTGQGTLPPPGFAN